MSTSIEEIMNFAPSITRMHESRLTSDPVYREAYTIHTQSGVNQTIESIFELLMADKPVELANRWYADEHL